MSVSSRPFAKEADVFEAAALAHRLEVTQLLGHIERLTAVLREHGILLPGEDPRLGASDGDHLEACRKVVVTAYDLLEAGRAFDEALSELRTLIGSGMEFVDQSRWRQ